jgi:phage regulator Rha-like protein
MKTIKIIEALKLMDVDGDTMQHILREVNLEGQLLKQLVMTSNDLNLTNAIEERLSFNEFDSLKDYWREVYNREGELRSVAKKSMG